MLPEEWPWSDANGAHIVADLHAQVVAHSRRVEKLRPCKRGVSKRDRAPQKKNALAQPLEAHGGIIGPS